MGFERGNEPSGFMKFREFLGYVRKCKPLKKDVRVAISCKRVQKTVVLTGWFEPAKARQLVYAYPC